MSHHAETEARLAALCEQMRALEWVRGKSGEAWAVKWGVSLDRVNHLAAEAWRRVKAEVCDPDRVTVKISTVLEEVIDAAMLETRDPAMIDGGAGRDGERRVYQESPNGARRVVVEAAKTWAAIVGAQATIQHEVTVTGGPSAAQARKAVASVFGHDVSAPADDEEVNATDGTRGSDNAGEP